MEGGLHLVSQPFHGVSEMRKFHWCLRNKGNGKPVAIGLLDKQLIVGLDCQIEACNWWSDKKNAEWVLDYLNQRGEFKELQVDMLTEREELSIPAIRDSVRWEEAVQAFKDLGIGA
jgi:hypothetical protein